MKDWRNGRPRCNFWHYRSLPTNWFQKRRHTYQYVGGNGDSTQGDQPRLLKGLHIYIQRNKCTYAESKKHIYGTIEASLQLWTKLSKIPEEMGYQRNKYDWCVMNKISRVNSSPYSDMLTTWRCCMLIMTLSLAFFLVLTQNMERLQKWPLHGVRYTNNLGLT